MSVVSENQPHLTTRASWLRVILWRAIAAALFWAFTVGAQPWWLKLIFLPFALLMTALLGGFVWAWWSNSRNAQ